MDQKKTNTGRIIATSPEERVKIWKDHFSNSHGQPPIIDYKPIVKVFDTLPIETDDFIEIELDIAVKALKI